MKRATMRKLKSRRGSGIAEALVGFLISVLSVLTLVGIATTTLELIKQGDANLQVLYREEGKMDTFVNEGANATGLGADGHLYVPNTEGGVEQKYTITAIGEVGGMEEEGIAASEKKPTGDVAYYVTNHHHLFGFVPITNPS